MGSKEEYERAKAAKKRTHNCYEALKGFGENTFRHPDRITRFTFYVAVFSGLLFTTAFLQTWAFIQSERAYLSVSHLRFDTNADIGSGKPLVLFFDIKNSGKSTAQITGGNINWAVGKMSRFPTGPQDLPFPPNSNIGASDIPAGESDMNIFRPEKTELLTPDIIASIMSGTDSFYVLGTIEYEDDFWSRSNTFCFVYDTTFSHPGTVTAFSSCPKQNGMTQK